MKKLVYVVVVLLVVVGCVSLGFADIRVKETRKGGAGLQNVHNSVVCVDGFKVFQTIVFGFTGEGGTAVSNIQLMEEKNGALVPVSCSN